MSGSRPLCSTCVTVPTIAEQVLGPHLPGLCDSMLSTALFDREVNVRRAAAAALQASAVAAETRLPSRGRAESYHMACVLKKYFSKTSASKVLWLVLFSFLGVSGHTRCSMRGRFHRPP